MTCRFGEVTALEDVGLRLTAGEIHALVGLNGAGKTTLMRALLGMVEPRVGEARVLDLPAGAAPSATWARVGSLVETPFSYAELTVLESVHIAARLRGLTRPAARTAAGAVLEDLGLAELAGRRSHTLSLGNRQRLGLACALVHRPDVVILDEPTNGLDPRGVVLVRERLLGIARSGAGILVSSHHLDEIARLADRISVLHRGRLIGTLDPRGVDLERAFFTMVYAAEGAPREVEAS